MNCDLCGKSGEMFRAVVEGSQVTVCSDCGKYGSSVEKIITAIPENKKFQVTARTEAVEVVVSNFGALLKKKREELGLNQKDFAKKIAEKESSLHKLEIGSLGPTLERARKLEKLLGLRVIEKVQEEPVMQQQSKAEVTLGDMVRIKRRKSK